MNKIMTLVALLYFMTLNEVYAQITTYNKYDVLYEEALEVEDFSSDEIKAYNGMLEAGIPKESVIMAINAGRATLNLKYAPATIIDYSFQSELGENDSILDAIGACGIVVELINSTTKTIKEITLVFTFWNYDQQVFDIKTGDSYCTLKFNNLEGRTKETDYGIISHTILNCFHELKMSDASYKKMFFNKKANKIRLQRASIKYDDGTTSNKIAVYQSEYGDGFILDGPLRPIARYLMSSLQSEETTNPSSALPPPPPPPPAPSSDTFRIVPPGTAPPPPPPTTSLSE